MIKKYKPTQASFTRYWQYQKERFPIFKNGILIASFSSSAVSLSALLRGQNNFPPIETFAVSFFVIFLTFFQLRAADEFKDADIDALYRPERPVPRGLVTLQELKFGVIVTALIQCVCVYIYDFNLLIPLLFIWAYMALMKVEFFVPKWLKARPIIYMTSHMLIMPIIDFFATATEWIRSEFIAPHGLIWFLIGSFFNGMVIEIGRKTWAPEMEKMGVESYSSAWGYKNAIKVWLVAIIASYLCAIVVSSFINFLLPCAVILSGMLIYSSILIKKFYKSPNKKISRELENTSAVWVLCIYFLLGVIAMGSKSWF